MMHANCGYVAAYKLYYIHITHRLYNYWQLESFAVYRSFVFLFVVATVNGRWEKRDGKTGVSIARVFAT